MITEVIYIHLYTQRLKNYYIYFADEGKAVLVEKGILEVQFVHSITDGRIMIALKQISTAIIRSIHEGCTIRKSSACAQYY